MDRRGFLRFAGGAAFMWPLTAFAQKAPVVIGFLGGQPQPPSRDPRGIALLQGFADNGLVIGRDFIFEPRFTAGDDARFPEFARELARLNARIILANSPAGVRAAQRLEPAVPVVMTAMTDPVAAGLVNSLAHPGNHTTGTASLNEDVTPKLLEFIREILPKANALAVLFNPSNSTNAPMVNNLQAKANSLGISVTRYALRSSGDLDPLFSMLTSKPPDALQLISDATVNEFLSGRIADYAIANRLPSFSSNESSFENGVLLTYGASTLKILRRTAYYVRRILDGAIAGDLPIEQPTGFDLFINAKTAKAIGIEIPATLLARADRIIE
ncbi:ABC transporter substrate-binding protein [Bradyrhizobium lablabi]|uniref:ABC transporter substrate-binding protein n=1 Tax=Bradyrhizobium lablabi TaxID=722472 RepID=UPI001BAC55D3|nr:ABC transporter substrate-binding protein [Bradyrhizobium lablabi]MBR0697902.1 ABC transporter substrate-binding protein [Bradyrhizobium lablabi]